MFTDGHIFLSLLFCFSQLCFYPFLMMMMKDLFFSLLFFLSSASPLGLANTYLRESLSSDSELTYYIQNTNLDMKRYHAAISGYIFALSHRVSDGVDVFG
jgi:hypothetical protein